MNHKFWLAFPEFLTPGLCPLPPPDPAPYRAWHLAASWKRKVDLWHSSSLNVLGLVLEHTNDSIYKEFSLLSHSFSVHKLNKSSNEKHDFCFLPASGEHNHDEVHVVGIRRPPLVSHQLQHLPFDPPPCCSHLITKAEQMFHIFDQVLSPTCWMRTEIIFCSVLLK